MTRAWARQRGPHPSYLAGGAILLAAACEVLFLLRHSGEWTQSQLGAIRWQGGAAELLAPIAAAAAAAGAQAVSGSALGVIARVQRRDRAAVGLGGLRFSLPLIAVHLVAMAVAVAVARGRGLEGAPPLAGWLPGALMIVAFSFVGAVLGWRMRSVVAAPVAAALAYAVLVVVTVSLDLPLLDVSAGARAVGLGLRGDWVVASSASALLIAVAALAATPVGRISWWYGVAGAALVAVVALSLVGPSESVRRAREALVCTGSSPQVCGFPERRRLLEPTRAAIVRVSAAIARLDPAAASLPARWTEGPLRRGAGDGALEATDPQDHAALVDAVVGQVTRCVPDDVVVDASSLGVWVARAVYGPGDAAVSSLAVGIPAPRLAPERLRQAARRTLLVARRHPCR